MIYDELILNFILALVAVAVLSLFVLGKLSIVVLVCFTVVRPSLSLLLPLGRSFCLPFTTILALVCLSAEAQPL